MIIYLSHLKSLIIFIASCDCDYIQHRVRGHCVDVNLLIICCDFTMIIMPIILLRFVDGCGHIFYRCGYGYVRDHLPSQFRSHDHACTLLNIMVVMLHLIFYDDRASNYGALRRVRLNVILS